MMFISLSLFIACSGKSSDTGSEPDTGSDTSTDALFAGLDFILIESEGYTPVSETITLGFPSETEFQFSGGCNSFFGEFDVDGDTFNASSIGGTEMGCDTDLMTEDDWLANFFSSSPTFDFQESTLSFENEGVTLTFGDRETLIPDASFEETLWIIDTYIEGEVAIAYNLITTPSVQFGSDGSIDLNTGCNGGFGEYSLDEDSLSVTMTAYTDAFCDDEDGQAAESIIVSVFMGPTVEVELNENRLTLTNGSRGITAYASE